MCCCYLQRASEVLGFINSNDHFFLNLSMAACKSALDSAAGIKVRSSFFALFCECAHIFRWFEGARLPLLPKTSLTSLRVICSCLRSRLSMFASLQGSTLVTTMARNGVNFGLRLSGRLLLVGSGGLSE